MTFSPSRRDVTKAAAWSAPVLGVAAVAPSLAASPAPDLSTSVQGTGSGRTSAEVLRIAPATLTNTGGLETGGLVLTMSSSGPAIENFQLEVFGTVLDPSALGVTVSGLGTNDITVNIPASLANIAPGASWTSPAAQLVTFADASETTLTVVATAVNGGVPFSPAPTPVPALAP